MDIRRKSTSQYSLLCGMGEHLLYLVCESAPRDQLGNWLRVPLEHAAAKGDLECVEKLVSAGADPFVRRRAVVADRSPLVAACQAGDEGVVKVLLRHGAGPDGEFRLPAGKAPCNFTSGAGASTASAALDPCRRSSSSSASSNGAQGWSCWGGGAGFSCESTSANEGSARWSPLHCAASRGHVAAVRALVAAGADKDAIDDESCTALHLAVFRGFEGVVEELVAAGANVDTHDIEGETPLHTAAGHGNLSMVKAIIRASTPEVINGNGGVHLLLSPLHRAALGGHSEVICELLAHGASLNSLACNARTALHACAMSGSGAAVRLLLEKNMVLEATDDEGCTATHIAAGHRLGSDATLEALLLAGANMEARTNTGETPLHRACKSLREDTVKRLLRFGADESATDADGRTPAALASELLQTQSPGVYRNRLNEILIMLAKAPADRIWRRRGWLVVIRTRLQRREWWSAVVAATTADRRRKQRRGGWGGILIDLPNILTPGRVGPRHYGNVDEEECVIVPLALMPAHQQENVGCKRVRHGCRGVLSPDTSTVDNPAVLDGWYARFRVGVGHGEYGAQGKGVGGMDSRIFGGAYGEAEGVGEGEREAFHWVVQRIVGLEEDGIFRAVVGFL